MPEQSTERLTEAGGSIAATDGGSGRYRVLCINEGTGSSGTYPASTLREAATKQLIGQGTPAYFDHPSASEAADRPERSVRDIAGVFTGPASWSDEHNGLVAELQVFAPYRQIVAEMAPHIGLSIRGSGVMEAARDGSRTVTALESIDSVDLVTKAGRGGKFLSLLESARPTGFDAADMAASFGVACDEPAPTSSAAPAAVGEAAPAATPTPTEETTLMPQIEEARLGQLEEAAGRVPVLEAERDAAIARATAAEAALTRHQLVAEARPLIAAQLAEAAAPLPAAAQARVVEAVVAAGIPAGENGVDTDALTAAVEAVATREAAYLAAITPAAPVAEAWGSFVPAARTEVAESDALTAYDTAAASIFGRKGA